MLIMSLAVADYPVGLDRNSPCGMAIRSPEPIAQANLFIVSNPVFKYTTCILKV